MDDKIINLINNSYNSFIKDILRKNLGVAEMLSSIAITGEIAKDIANNPQALDAVVNYVELIKKDINDLGKEILSEEMKEVILKLIISRTCTLFSNVSKIHSEDTGKLLDSAKILAESKLLSNNSLH